MRTLGVAAAVAAVVIAAGLGLQAAALPAADGGRVAAIRAVEWLMRYRFASSSVSFHGRVVHGHCFHGWFEGVHEHPQHGTLLLLDDGASVRALGPNLVTEGPRVLTPLATLELAGCTSVLAPRVATLAVDGAAVGVRRVSIAGQRALALRFPHMTLFVARSTGRPLGVALLGAYSTIHLTRLTAQVARSLARAE